MQKIILLLSFFSTFSFAQVLVKNENGDFKVTKNTFRVSEVLNDYVRLEQQSLILGETFSDDTLKLEGNMVISRDVFPAFLSSLLYQSGNTILYMSEGRVMHVIANREARYRPLSVYKNAQDIPGNYNFVQFTYPLKYIEGAELTRNLRPLLSRYGRMIDDGLSNSVHITDMGNNVLRMIKIIELLDNEAFLNDKKQADEINRKNEIVIKAEKSLVEIFSEQQGLFLIAFFLIGGIIGFGSRGYMMKKVEGGW